MTDDTTGSPVRRRMVLSCIGGVIGTATAGSGLAVAESTDSDRFVGSSYDPVTDKHQGDAAADLDITEDGLRGRLSVAGFDLELGRDGRLTEESGSARPSKSYSFCRTDPEFTVTAGDRELSLTGSLDVYDAGITGTLDRPSANYGSIAFSLLPAVSHRAADVTATLRPEARRDRVAGFDAVEIPATGIPTSNSIEALPAQETASETELDPEKCIAPHSAGERTEGYGGGVSPESSDKDIGFLSSDTAIESMRKEYDGTCTDERRYTDWQFTLGTSADVRYNGDGSVFTEYDEIAAGGGFKRIQLHSFFQDKPQQFVPSCTSFDRNPTQKRVEFSVNQTQGTTQDESSLSKPEPQLDTDDPGSGLLGLGLKITATIAGSVWVGIGSTLVEYALNTESSSGGIEHRTNFSEDGRDQEQYYWNLPLDLSTDETGERVRFADSPHNAATATLKVENGTGSGRENHLKTSSQFVFQYFDHSAEYCPCPDTGLTYVPKTAKTAKLTNVADYESVTPNY